MLYLGKPEFPPPPETPRQAEASRLIDRELAIDDAIENVRYSTRSCPGCEYPAPDWRVYCRVCGFEFGRVPPRPGPNDELEQR
jgi:biotin synthase-related radical SAM superfamily protein